MRVLRKCLIGAILFNATGTAHAGTDYIAPGTPATVGRSGSLVGSAPGVTVPAPRGAMETLGLRANTPGDRRAAAKSAPDASRNPTVTPTH